MAGSQSHQRQDHVAFLDVILDPLAVDRDVAFEEVKTRVFAQGAMRSLFMSCRTRASRSCSECDWTGDGDEAIDAKDQDIFIVESLHGRPSASARSPKRRENPRRSRCRTEFELQTFNAPS